METIVVVLVDESKSTSTNANENLRHLNNFIDEQRNLYSKGWKSRKCRFFLVMFSDEARVVINGLPLSDIPRIRKGFDYHPHNITCAIYDAIDDTIKLIDVVKSENESVVFAIISNGNDENNVDESQFTYQDVVYRILLARQRVNNWSIRFFGNNKMFQKILPDAAKIVTSNLVETIPNTVSLPSRTRKAIRENVIRICKHIKNAVQNSGRKMITFIRKKRTCSEKKYYNDYDFATADCHITNGYTGNGYVNYCYDEDVLFARQKLVQ